MLIVIVVSVILFEDYVLMLLKSSISMKWRTKYYYSDECNLSCTKIRIVYVRELMTISCDMSKAKVSSPRDLSECGCYCRVLCDFLLYRH